MPSAIAAPPAGPVLLFDGACGLCQRVVQGLLRIDRHARLRFAPLQGPAAQAYLRRHGLPETGFDTLVFVPDWAQRERPEYQLRSAGVVAALRAVGGLGRPLAAMLAPLPAAWRDAGYDRVARGRATLFGPWQAQTLPRPEWAARFLDRE